MDTSLSSKTHLQLLALGARLDLCPSSKLMAFAKEIGHPRKGGGDGGKSLGGEQLVGLPGQGQRAHEGHPDRVWWAPLHLAKELEGQVRDPDSLGKMEHLAKRNRLSTAQPRASVLHTKVLKNLQKHKNTVITFTSMQTLAGF